MRNLPIDGKSRRAVFLERDDTMANILIIAFSNLRRDPAVRRQVTFLRDTHKVTIIGPTDQQMEGLELTGCCPNGNPKQILAKWKISDVNCLSPKGEF